METPAVQNADDRDRRAKDEQFVRLLTGCQNQLYAFILSLLPDPHAASDVLQETNVVMWRKADEYAPETDFAAWACRVAYFEIRSYRRNRARDRHVFDESLLDNLAQGAAERVGRLGERFEMLDDCLAALTPEQQELIRLRYRTGGSIREVAQTRQQSSGSIATMLFRIRKLLLDCIERKQLAGRDR